MSLDLFNSTNITVNYRYRTVASNSWSTATVESAKTITHFRPPSTDGQIYPPMEIECTGDINGGEKMMSGQIAWKMVRDPKKDDGARYYFAVRDGFLGLFTGVPPGSQSNRRPSNDQPDQQLQPPQQQPNRAAADPPPGTWVS